MITRCLGPFSDRINNLPRELWAGLVKDQPEACPNSDCSEAAGCRAICAEYARVQWKIQVRAEAERLKGIPKTQEARAAHLQQLLGDFDS